ncbi:STAS domain-containing protein [Streptomyces sp. NPDC085481]|uniref:STAS domain-containing protein n=1 Tax=Streptomyces sp. NPDC085481 TaxID=3365727 RepID=UPI0037D8626F
MPLLLHTVHGAPARRAGQSPAENYTQLLTHIGRQVTIAQEASLPLEVAMTPLVPEGSWAVSRPALADAAGVAITVRPTASSTVVSVHGEVDMDNAGDLRMALLRAIAACPDGAAVHLDLSEVSFCDSVGLNVLLRARNRALSEHRALIITAASPRVLRLLEMTRTSHLFGITV